MTCEDCRKRKATRTIEGAHLCGPCYELERELLDHLKILSKQATKPFKGCRRCQCEDTPTRNGLCLACEKTESLPGLEPTVWTLELTAPPSIDRKPRHADEAQQATLF